MDHLIESIRKAYNDLIEQLDQDEANALEVFDFYPLPLKDVFTRDQVVTLARNMHRHLQNPSVDATDYFLLLSNELGIIADS